MILNRDHRGRTATGKHTYRPLVEPEPSDFAPDSNYWHGRMIVAVGELVAQLGRRATNAWFKATFTADASPSHWAIAIQAEEKLHSLATQPEDPHTVNVETIRESARSLSEYQDTHPKPEFN